MSRTVHRAAPTPYRQPRSCQPGRMMREMIRQKAGDEVIAVVVTRPQIQRERMAHGLAGRLQQFRP